VAITNRGVGTWNSAVLVIDNWEFVVADRKFITGFRKQGKERKQQAAASKRGKGLKGRP
jgi:hypothetical protein